MDVKDAVTRAKQHMRELFAEEKIFNVGLEEVDFDEAAKTWRVTIGFSRPWDQTPAGPSSSPGMWHTPPRVYKVVRIRDSDGMVTVTNREPMG